MFETAIRSKQTVIQRKRAPGTEFLLRSKRKFAVRVFVLTGGSPILKYRRAAGTKEVIRSKRKNVLSGFVIMRFHCTYACTC